MSGHDLWVIVPAHQEEERLAGTLRALAEQRDRDFTLLVVDNASSDRTGAIARGFAADAPFPVEVLDEPEKGWAAPWTPVSATPSPGVRRCSPAPTRTVFPGPAGRRPPAPR